MYPGGSCHLALVYSCQHSRHPMADFIRDPQKYAGHRSRYPVANRARKHIRAPWLGAARSSAALDARIGSLNGVRPSGPEVVFCQFHEPVPKTWRSELRPALYSVRVLYVYPILRASKWRQAPHVASPTHSMRCTIVRDELTIACLGRCFRGARKVVPETSQILNSRIRFQYAGKRSVFAIFVPRSAKEDLCLRILNVYSM